MKFLSIIPVLESGDIKRDIAWYQAKTGFEAVFFDDMYAGLRRENIYLHLQWHAGTAADPLNGGAVIRIFVEDIQAVFTEFVERGTVDEKKLRWNTPWQTHEFGFYDLNKNAVFIVQDAA